jgi:hypothetical protein
LTAKKIVVLICNLCGATALSGDLTIRDAIHMEHPVDGVIEARSHAHAKGWMHDKLGRDVCSNCRTFPAPKNRHHKIHIPRPRW